MAQLTVRLADELAEDVKRAAHAVGRSVNEFVTTVLRAAVDPEFAGEEAERLRERLRRAGLLHEPEPRALRRPSRRRLRDARRAAGGGTPLSKLVSEDRGPR